MKKQINSFPIGNGKRLVLEHDPENPYEKEFIKECQAVAETKPANLQEFFITLAKIQRKNRERLLPDDEEEKQSGLKISK